MTDREKICKEFHEACGGHWHEWEWDTEGTSCTCRKCDYDGIEDNPKYLHPDEVLQKVMKWDGINDLADFLWSIGVKLNSKEWVIEMDYILAPDKLLIAAHKWAMERMRL